MNIPKLSEADKKAHPDHGEYYEFLLDHVRYIEEVLEFLQRDLTYLNIHAKDSGLSDILLHPIYSLLKKLMVEKMIPAVSVIRPIVVSNLFQHLSVGTEIRIMFDPSVVKHFRQDIHETREQYASRLRQANLWLEALIWASNGSHKKNPYHNHRHCLGVIAYSFACMRTELGLSKDEDFFNPELYLAGLFHDYGHSGRTHRADSENIKDALKGFREFCRYSPEVKEYVDVDEVANLISVTEFLGRDAGFKHEPQTLKEKCIRDADLMAISSFSGQCSLWDLSLEIKIPPSKFAVGNLEFLKGCTYYTTKGQQVQKQLNFYHEQLLDVFALQRARFPDDLSGTLEKLNQQLHELWDQRKKDIGAAVRKTQDDETRIVNAILDFEVLKVGEK